MILDDATRDRLRAQIMERGRGVSRQLSQVMAGKNVDLSSIRAVVGRPGMRPDELLRAYLDHLMSFRDALDANDGRYGRCRHCDAELSLAELEALPWADSCRECAGR